VADRLSPRDLAFLAREDVTAPRHNATLDILEPGESPFDYDAFLALVADRLSFVPRYRQRVQSVPGRLGSPVWVDDDRFDLEYHVRRSAVPRPGSIDQLRDLAARIVSRPLDRTRPLWEMYFVEGLENGRVAVLSKTHQALVDGADTVELGQILLDVRPDARSLGADVWQPRSASGPALLLDAVRDTLSDLSALPGTARGATAFLAGRASSMLHVAAGVAETITGRRAERPTPLSGNLSQSRLVVALDCDLDDFRRIRSAHGGTINDGILAVVTGGLRAWLMTRSESLVAVRGLPALVPVSVIDDDLAATALGSQIAPHFVQLPIGEVSPVVRLHQVSYSFESHAATGRAVAAARLAGITGFAPVTFHAMGSQLAAQVRASFALAVTNVPGPQAPRYAAGARLVASYPIHPLLPGHSLAIGVTSYDGRVFFGITADRRLVPDADVLGQCVLEALDELLDTATGGRKQAPRGRRPPRRKDTE
jgi:diacylglycerol O-acyltransferase / wax synthase